MAPEPFLSERQLEALRRLDTCTVLNAIEAFGVRLGNTRFADAGVPAAARALQTTDRQ